MKKIILVALIGLKTFDSFSQIEKGNIILTLDGNYVKTQSETGVNTNYTNTKGQYLNVGSSIGYFFTNRLVVGLGVDYNWEKETRLNELYITDYLQQEEMKIKSDVILPNLYVGYYYQILSNFYLSANAKISYGRVKVDYSTIYASRTTNGESLLYSNDDNTDYDYFSSKLFPELTYFYKRLGISLGLGGIEYSMTDWETGSSNWIISFHPNNWRFGIKVKI
jgi:hypothetical protein